MEIGDIDKDGRLSLKEYKSRYKLHPTDYEKSVFFFLASVKTGKSCNFLPSNLKISRLVVR